MLRLSTFDSICNDECRGYEEDVKRHVRKKNLAKGSFSALMTKEEFWKDLEQTYRNKRKDGYVKKRFTSQDDHDYTPKEKSTSSGVSRCSLCKEKMDPPTPGGDQVVRLLPCCHVVHKSCFQEIGADRILWCPTCGVGVTTTIDESKALTKKSVCGKNKTYDNNLLRIYHKVKKKRVRTK